MKSKKIALSIIVITTCFIAFIGASPFAGPGITVTYNSAIKDKEIDIKSAYFQNGKAFVHDVNIGGVSKPNENPLIGGTTMGVAPDGRELPEYIDFEWRESLKASPDPTPMNPFSQEHKDWEEKMLNNFYSQPIKQQRVLMRSRIPAEVLSEAISANSNTPKGHLDEASVHVYFIWTEYGIKLRWEIWHRKGGQYDSHHGGDELVPAGTTMIAAYSNIIANDNFVVDPGGPDTDRRPKRHPASASGTVFSGSPSFAYTDRPVSGGEKLMVFESEPELPEWIDFRWKLVPTTTISPKLGESESEFHWRLVNFYNALPSKSERVLVRNRIPQEVRDEIAAATRNAQPHKVASSVIYLYFVWTATGIRLHWRLKRSQPDGSFINVREGGDEIMQAATQ